MADVDISVVNSNRLVPTPLPNDATKFLNGAGAFTIPPAGAGGATNLDALTDVIIISPSTNQVIRFDGTNWVNTKILTNVALPTLDAATSQLEDVIAWANALKTALGG